MLSRAAVFDKVECESREKVASKSLEGLERLRLELGTRYLTHMLMRSASAALR